MTNKFTISADDIAEIEKACDLIRSGELSVPMSQVDRIEQVCRRIKAEHERQKKAMEVLVESLRGFCV